MGLVDYMKGNQWDVVHVAGVEGYQEPFEIKGYIPDVVARAPDGLIAVGMAGTCEVWSEDETQKQLSAFSDLTTKTGNRDVPFFVVVPESCIGMLEELLNTKYAAQLQRFTLVKMAGV
jgi:hypothetical protein